MYHVKNDKRSQTSAHAIYNGLIKLLQSTSFDNITVSAICEVSNISRATFYRNFDIIDDILIWYGNVSIKKLLHNFYHLPKEQKDMSLDHYALLHALEESEYIETLAKNKKMHLIEPTVLALLESAPLNFDIHESPYIKYAIYAKVGSFFSVINCWIDSGKKETIEDFQNHLTDIVKYIHTINVEKQ